MDDLRKNRSDSDFEVTGVSRSGRVRKKSSKLMDFESPDEIDTRPRKLPPPKPQPQPHVPTFHTNQRSFVQEPDPDSDVDVQNDTKSETEDVEGGTSDSDCYDPTMDNQDSLDSMDSDDNALSEKSFNSSSEQLGRSSSKPSNSLFLADRSGKRKPSISDINKDKSKLHKKETGSDSRNNSFHHNYNSSSMRHRSSSRNRHSSRKSSSIHNSLTNALGNNIQDGATGMYVEVGAHLRLLGESLAIIGERLKEHEGQIAVSGSVSVLLDTLLCSLAPLICLTAHLPSIAPPLSLLHDTLDNIAYIMPGL